ncbi:Trm112 family protein [Ahrensia sp. R2A130]|uniref:Trm112 family protein n=1 Tax=Ahrensia sp. R2A130 TaxID=744979 RepID=UPI00058D6CA7|nr:Trm112 family protein [Ahrensia sp. R2A130]
MRGEAPSLSVKMLELLVCPRSHGSLVYDETAQELTCKRSLLAYPVRDGVPILLESEARAIED